MKAKTSFIPTVAIAILILFTQTGCAQERNTTRRTFQTASFDSVEANTVANIVFTQSTTTSVVAEGDAKLIESLRIGVENNTLTIESKNKIAKRLSLKRPKLEIRISSPQIVRLLNDGLGNVSFEGEIETQKLKISLDGMGNLNAPMLNCASVVIESDGMGNIHLGGKTNELIISSDGMGNVDTKKLLAKTAKVSSDGMGNVAIYASDSLDIESDGIGNVSYYGNPAQKQISKDGIGRVKRGK